MRPLLLDVLPNYGIHSLPSVCLASSVLDTFLKLTNFTSANKLQFIAQTSCILAAKQMDDIGFDQYAKSKISANLIRVVCGGGAPRETSIKCTHLCRD